LEERGFVRKIQRRWGSFTSEELGRAAEGADLPFRIAAKQTSLVKDVGKVTTRYYDWLNILISPENMIDPC
jgi:hypothetical protein